LARANKPPRKLILYQHQMKHATILCLVAAAASCAEAALLRREVAARAAKRLFQAPDDEVGVEGEVSDSVHDLESSIVNILDNNATGKPKKGGKTDLGKTVGVMVKMVNDDMKPKVIDAKKAAQAQLDGLYNAFDACTGKKTSAMLGVPAAVRTKKKQSTNHKNCRKRQADKQAKADGCAAVQKAEEDAKKAACDGQDALSTDPNKEADTCHTNGGEKYSQWVDRIDTWITTKAGVYRKAAKACKVAGGKAARQKKTCDPLVKASNEDKTSCDAMQEALETTTCTIATTATKTCGEYVACYNAARQALQEQLPAIKKLEANRRAEWRALMRMECLLKLFADGEAEEKEVDKCKEKTHKTDHLNLKYGKMPDPEKCESPVADPCGSQYVSEEYAGLPSDAPAKDCLTCSGLGNTIPLPDGFNVRCKHDTEWAYVLDYSDDRSKDDIPNNVGALASGFANSNAFYIGNSAVDDLDIETAQMCVLSSSKRMKNGNCQWSCKTLDDGNFNDGVNCNGCKKLSSGVKKAIAAVSGQSRGGDILKNLDAGIASFQEDMSAISWMCGGYKRFYSWGHGWHAQGWGISFRPDHNPGSYEIGWYSNHCGFRAKMDVDTFQVRVQLKAKKIVVPKFSKANFGVTTFEERCKHEKDWQYVLDYSDQLNVDDIPGDRNVLANGFDSVNAYYIGNEKLNDLDIKEAEMCFLSSSKKDIKEAERLGHQRGACPISCVRIDDKKGDIPNRLLYENAANAKAKKTWLRCPTCDKSKLKTNLMRAIASLTGQGTGGYMVYDDTRRGFAPFSKPYQSVRWSCHKGDGIRALNSGDGANAVGFHAAYSGLTLRAERGAGKAEVGWIWTSDCGWKNKLHVDTFQIRVRT